MVPALTVPQLLSLVPVTTVRGLPHVGVQMDRTWGGRIPSLLLHSYTFISVEHFKGKEIAR